MKITNDQHKQLRSGAWTYESENVYITDDTGAVWSIRPSPRGGLNIVCTKADGRDRICIAASVSNEIVIRAEDHNP